jgi:alpha-tubulin suppressor-like RCC1 family protein
MADVRHWDVAMWALATIVLVGCGRIAFDPRGDGGATTSDAPGLQFAAVVAANGHTCVLSNRNELACWGENTWGKLGIGDTTNRGVLPGQIGPSLPRPDLGTMGKPVALTSTADYTCALLDNATAKCWGNNDGAQLGVGDYASRGDMPGEMGDQLPIVQVSGSTQIAQIATGHYHTCTLTGGAVRCFGKNDVSQNGYGNGSPIDTIALLQALPAIDLGTGFTTASISINFNATCVLSTAQTVKCWGYNPNGALGYGDTLSRGGAPGEMGDALPLVDLGAPPDVLMGGAGHLCALFGGRLKCWGDNSLGQLGLGDTNNRGDQPGEMGTALPFVDLGTNRTATAISPGSGFTCALLDGGDVKCWGRNPQGQLGLGDTLPRGTMPGQMGDALPRVPLPGPARAVFAGGTHACAILVSGELTCWGQNNSGQLGVGDTQNRGDQPGEVGTTLIPPSQLWTP